MDQEAVEVLMKSCNNDPANLEKVIGQAANSIRIARPDKYLIAWAVRARSNRRKEACRLAILAHLHMADITTREQLDIAKERYTGYLIDCTYP